MQHERNVAREFSDAFLVEALRQPGAENDSAFSFRDGASTYVGPRMYAYVASLLAADTRQTTALFMILHTHTLASTAAVGGGSGARPFATPRVQHVCHQQRSRHRPATSMVLTSDSSDIPPVSSWKPPWEARRETRGLLTDGGYDPAVMDSYFELRPERALIRVAQVREPPERSVQV